MRKKTVSFFLNIEVEASCTAASVQNLVHTHLQGLEYSLQPKKPPHPPRLFLELASYIPLDRPFRQGWEAALSNKPRSAIPLFRCAERKAQWELGWDLALHYWTKMEMLRYKDGLAARQAERGSAAQNENHLTPRK